MAKIVYGLSGEGSGHSSRTAEIAPFIQDLGHELKLVSYDRGYQNLKDDFDVFEIEGLHIASADNKVSLVNTFTENLQKLPEGHRTLNALRKEVFKSFKPDCVICDFEPMTAYLATHYDLPLISLDNQHRFRYMKYSCPLSMKKDQILTENIIRAMVPRPDVSIVTTFFFGELKNDRTFLFPPILRKAVLELRPIDGDHILVYLTSGFESLIECLKSFRRENFLIYGYNKNDIDENLVYKPFSKEGFLKDLESCKAVIATAGFTLISEAIHLGKPYLAVPMLGQFEQEMNAIFLDKLRYGVNLRKIREQAIGDFFYHIPDYKDELQSYKITDNSLIKTKLAELLDNNCAEAREYHQKRKS